MQKIHHYILLLLGLFCSFSSCKNSTTPAGDAAFVLLEADKTGIDFSNDISPTHDLNIFSYMYFYNGGGTGAGDLNNDGLVDLVFTANIKENKIYLNKGEMKFEDISQKANFKGDKGWSNGVSVVDINQDGKLDIYISQVAGFETMKGHNLLFVCQEITKEGVPIYAEKSKEYGLALVGFGTQAAFFDYDLDGDLDMFMLNHSVHQNGTFGGREAFKNSVHPTAGDKMFENKAGKFIEITNKTGVLSTALGYGLGLCISDINLDGYPDMYVGNDFHENDYLYINQKNGSFKEDLENEMMHTSQFSMGVDIADINNDIFPEVISLDMMPYDRNILKRSEGEDSYNIFQYKLQQGYSHQFARNNLQLNNRNNTFSEIGMYADIFATDWSWGSLFLDFDNDGQKDLFISNGIPKRMNDTDYINYVSAEGVQQKIRNKEIDESDASMIDKIPEIKIPNKFFANSPTLQFKDLEHAISNAQNSYSNGAIYADLDNDGDLDIVTNNINQKAFVYQNLAEQYAPKNQHLRIELKGSAQNKNAIGTRILVFKQHETISYEKYPVRGFQSSMEIPILLGLGDKTLVDSIHVIWPDRRFQKIDKASIQKNATLALSYQAHLPLYNYTQLQPLSKMQRYEDVSIATGLNIKHEENTSFIEFNKQNLLPHMLSAEGPALAVADVNNDGLEDVYMGSSKTSKQHLFLQDKNGKFRESIQPALEKDSINEEVDAVFVDVNNDASPDLIVAEGGNEFSDNSEYLAPKVYLNKGKGTFNAHPEAFTNIFMTASCVRPVDFNKDGKMDLFIGGRAIPNQYGVIPHSYLLLNDGTGKFSDATNQYAKELSTIGFVKNATWQDLDKDGDQDLLLALEWDGICEMENKDGKLAKKMLTKEKGWWNFTLPYDFDGDGDLDILAGNLGLNNRLKATAHEPTKMYVNDFDKNGSSDVILSYYLGGEEIIFANKMETQLQFPFTKKKYLLAKDFAQASISDLFGNANINAATQFEANYFQNTVLVNDGKGNFTLNPLPFNAQFSPYYTAEIIDANGDKLPDVMILGNFYDCNIQMGRYDADYGMVLINKGACHFEASPINGLQIKGQVKRSHKIKINGQENIIIARNNDKLMVVRQVKPQ